jgi:hypothetical protein
MHVFNKTIFYCIEIGDELFLRYHCGAGAARDPEVAQMPSKVQ